MSIEKDVIEYLRGVNPQIVDRMDDPRKLKVRRVLDSLGMVEFLAFLEKEFSVKIADRELLSNNFDTIDSVIALVEAKCPKER